METNGRRLQSCCREGRPNPEKYAHTSVFASHLLTPHSYFIPASEWISLLTVSDSSSLHTVHCVSHCVECAGPITESRIDGTRLSNADSCKLVPTRGWLPTQRIHSLIVLIDGVLRMMQAQNVRRRARSDCTTGCGRAATHSAGKCSVIHICSPD